MKNIFIRAVVIVTIIIAVVMFLNWVLQFLASA